MLKKAINILLLLVIASGCASKKKEDFIVETEMLPKDGNNTIKCVGYLVNKGDKDLQITHSSPLIQYEVYEGDKILKIVPAVTFSKGYKHLLQQNERFNPDDAVSIELENGEYTIVAVASFSINEKEKKRYQIKSSPIHVTIQN